MNTENLCHICLEEAFSTSFNFQESVNEATIYDLIKKICPDVCLENKPHQICSSCLNMLKVACEFKQKCETSDLFLRNINFERKFPIFDETEDFIDTNLMMFDDDYILDPDYMDDLKPDFDSLDSKAQSEVESNGNDTRSTQSDPQNPPAEKRKVIRHHSKTLKCFSCSETFAGPLKLMIHSRNIHQDLKPFKCEFTSCTRAYQNPKALKVHWRLHQIEKPFKCDECQAEFHVKANLLAHVRIHTGEKFKCSFCEKLFSTASYFKQHQLQHIREASPVKHFICDYKNCGKSFSDRKSLRSHQSIHEERKFNCEICNSKFRTSQSLKIHHLKHTDIKQFTCHICGVLFKYKNQCYDHVRAHTAKRELECFHCSKKFIKKTLLATHMQTHLTVRKFSCVECNKTFKTYNCLYAHKRRHKVRIANFSCASCDKSFTSRSDLTNHVRTHTQEKQFACHFENCTKIFVHKANLNVHFRSHLEPNGFNCDICNKALANSNALRVHLNKVHKAEKKFPCVLCTLTFASPQLLKIHEEIHKTKKFTCTFCNQRYNFAADLERHLAKMHQDHQGDEGSGVGLVSKKLK